MSRLEQALEKAARMRGSKKDIAPEESETSTEQVSFPRFKNGEVKDLRSVDKHLVCITEPRSAVAEQYKKLRTRILKATKDDFLNTIMVTSSYIGEGKTITAINLAVSLANMADHTVLLVDTDLRNPSIHKYLGIEQKFGLSEYLKGEAHLPDILLKTGVGNLVVLPGGRPSDNPAELISSESMKRLVQEMKQRYRDRYIIFDSSPVISTADTLLLGSCMDGIIFVVKADHTPESTVTKALSLLNGTNILGVVLNDMPHYLTRNIAYQYYYR
jgi:exopolysaccharide/PEP-CTERM locus tyrosine autokinase